MRPPPASDGVEGPTATLPSPPGVGIGRLPEPLGEAGSESPVRDALPTRGAARSEGWVAERSRQRAEQPVVGQSGRVVEGEPGHVLALTRRRSRIPDAAVEEEAEVEVEMTVRRRVDVCVQQPWRPGRWAHCEAGLLDGLSAGGDLGRLPGVDVPAGLQPAAEATVAVEEDPAGPDHDSRSGHVGRVGLSIEGRSQPGDLDADPLDRRCLPSIDRPVTREEPGNERTGRAGRVRHRRHAGERRHRDRGIAHERRR